ncbi:MAG: hypothetical protein FJ027_12100 [Candidatus Rokubacteria bacterium]|nr:hypothetical protein [Candidatus Rokubacteria bacterium]
MTTARAGRLDDVKLAAAIVYALAVMVSSGPLLTIPLGVPGLGWKRVVPADLAFVLMLGVWAAAVAADGWRRTFPRRVWREPGLVLLAVALSALASGAPARGVPDLLRFAYSLTAFVVIAQLPLDTTRLRRFATAYTAGAVAVCVVSVGAWALAHAGVVTPLAGVDPAPGFQGPAAVRTMGPFGHPTTLAVFLCTALSLAAVRGGAAPGRWTSPLVAGAIALFAVTGLLTASRAVAALVVAAFAWALAADDGTRRRRVRTVVLGQLALVGALFTAITLTWNIVPVTITTDPATKFTSVQVYAAPDLRRLLYGGALRMVAEHPLLGVGPGLYADHIKRLLVPAEVGEASRYLASQADGGVEAFWGGTPDPHSSWFGWLARTGLIGFGAMAWLFAFHLRRFWRGRRAAGARGVVSRWALAGVVGVLFAGLAVEVMHLRFLWVLLGVAVAATDDARS